MLFPSKDHIKDTISIKRSWKRCYFCQRIAKRTIFSSKNCKKVTISVKRSWTPPPPPHYFHQRIVKKDTISAKGLQKRQDFCQRAVTKTLFSSKDRKNLHNFCQMIAKKKHHFSQTIVKKTRFVVKNCGENKIFVKWSLKRHANFVKSSW